MSGPRCWSPDVDSLTSTWGAFDPVLYTRD